MKNPDGLITIEADTIYYEGNTNQLNAQGLVHLHLLLAGELQLQRIRYRWYGMPLVRRQAAHREVTMKEVQKDGSTGGAASVPLQMKKGHGNRRCNAKIMAREYPELDSSGTSVSSEPPILVRLCNSSDNYSN